MDDHLEKLIEAARKVKMTPEQWEAQRRSFAYGNTKIENDRITRELIDDVARAMAQEDARRTASKQ